MAVGVNSAGGYECPFGIKDSCIFFDWEVGADGENKAFLVAMKAAVKDNCTVNSCSNGHLL